MSGRGRFSLATMSSAAFGRLLEAEARVVILQPVGSVEPHGPHMSLVTDTVISEAAAERAAGLLEQRGLAVRIAPSIPYGVTDCAAGFAGAVSVPAEAVAAFLRAVVDGYLQGGVAHVCLVNNHLEPAQDRAVRTAIAHLEAGRASVACPLTRRWARTLSDEFKSGACHAGQYETSVILAAEPALVDDAVRASLPEVPISLSDKLRAGVGDFVTMGLWQAYAGAPAAASREEGDILLDRLAEMIAGEVWDAIEPG